MVIIFFPADHSDLVTFRHQGDIVKTFEFKSFISHCIVFYKNTFSSSGHDVIAQAQSGTGKTATFAISILQQLEIEQKETQALVLAPTRELAQQVCCSLGPDDSSVPQT